MLKDFEAFVVSRGIEIKYLKKYNSLKLKKEIEIRNLEKYTNELIQQLAEARADLEITKTHEKLARKQIKELKEVIKDLKKEDE